MPTLHLLLISPQRQAAALHTLADAARQTFTPAHGWTLHVHWLRGPDATQAGIEAACRDCLTEAQPEDGFWLHFLGRVTAQGWHSYDGIPLSALMRERWLDHPGLPAVLLSADPTEAPRQAPRQLPSPQHKADYLYLSCLPADRPPLPPLGPAPFTLALAQALPLAIDAPYARLRGLLRAALGALGWIPSLEGSGQAHAWQRLLTRRPAQDIPTVWVSHDGQQWRLQGGALQGIGPELMDSSLPVWRGSLAEPLPQTRLRVRHVGLEYTIVAVEGQPLDQGRRYLSALPGQGMPVFFSAEALDQTSSLWLDYPTLLPVAQAEGAPFAIRSTERGTALFAAEPERLIMGIERPLEEALPALLHTLRHITRWQRTLDLHNPESSLLPHEVGLELWPDGQGQALAAPVWSVDLYGAEAEVGFALYVENRSTQPLYVALLYADNQFGVTNITPEDLERGPILPRERQALIPRGAASLGANDPNQSEEHLVLLASLSPFPANLLTYPGLEPQQLYRWLATPPPPRMMTRSLRSPDPVTLGWTVRRLTISLRRQTARLGDQPGLLGKGSVTIQPHSQLRGYASLQATAPQSRSLGSEDPKRVLAVIPGISPLKPKPAQSGEARDLFQPELDHLEIVSETPITDAMLREEPLVLDWETDLADHEALLPLAFDGEFWVPVGRATLQADGRARVEIDHWPEQEVKSRSLGQALKLYFFKALVDQPGVKLQRAEFPPEGGVRRTEEGLQAAIDQAENVLIVIHGIIGNTADIAGSVRFAVEEGHYDLVLTFDYENLATSVSETAKRLKRLMQQHHLDQKTVDLVVHSMGGLVSRWLIEREGGDAFIRRLVMLGTPNGGSPFSALAPVIPALIALAANLQSPFLGGLVYALQFLNKSRAINRTLGDMDKESEMLLTLNTSEPPQTEYIIIAGDASVYQVEAESRLARLIEKALLGVGDLFNKAEQHDIAVPLASIFTLPKGVEATTYVEPGHHLNYFSYPDTLERLEAVLRGPAHQSPSAPTLS